MTDPDDSIRAKLSDASFTPDPHDPPVPAELAEALNQPGAELAAAARHALLAQGADVATRLMHDLGIPDHN